MTSPYVYVHPSSSNSCDYNAYAISLSRKAKTHSARGYKFTPPVDEAPKETQPPKNLKKPRKGKNQENSNCKKGKSNGAMKLICLNFKNMSFNA